MNPFECAYDGLSSIDEAEAHLFPDAIGGITAAVGLICRKHNNDVNSGVENPALPFFAPFRSLWGLAGRSGRIPLAPAILEFENGDSYQVKQGPDGEMRDAVVTRVPGSDGRKAHLIIGRRQEHLDSKRAEMSKKNPNLKWDGPVAYGQQGRLLTKVDQEPSKPVLRRLAAKIAFERLAQLRGGTFASGAEFAAIRSFILAGAEPVVMAGLVGDERFYREGHPLFVHAGNHLVVVAAQQDRLAAIVSFFGLYYYWVVLARPYQILATWDDLLIESPRPRRVQHPKLRGGVGTLMFPWEGWMTASLRDPPSVEAAVHKLAMDKLQAAVDSFYGPDSATEAEETP